MHLEPSTRHLTSSRQESGPEHNGPAASSSAPACGLEPAAQGAWLGSAYKIVVGLVVTWQQQRTIAVTRQRQLSERFSRAINHLGTTATDIQLGGIHEPEQLARQADDRRLEIYEVPAAHIRQHAAAPRSPSPSGQRLEARVPDVRAAVTVLGPPYHQWTAADPLDRLSVHLIMPLLPLELPDMPPSGSGGRAVGPQESSGIPGITS